MTMAGTTPPIVHNEIPRITAFEGLRGYLALWVFLGHVFWSCGWPRETHHPLLWVAVHPVTAVSVFIILSGFVITWLLLHRPEPYSTFLMRRFFRLYPIYTFLLLAALLSMNLKLATDTTLPFPDAEYFPRLQADLAVLSAPWTHFFLHLFMMHGIHEDTHTYTLLGQSWSLSLEWQFYLLAPFVVAMLLKRQTLLVLLAGFILTSGLKLALPDAMLFRSAHYFWIGIASCLVFRSPRLRALAAQAAWPLALLLGAGLALKASQALLALFIWMATFAVVLRGNAMAWIFTNRVALFLGKISYSFYLCHVMGLIAALQLCLPLAASLGQAGFTAAVLVSGVLLSLALATLLHYTIEVPGIRLGQRLLKPKVTLIGSAS